MKRTKIAPVLRWHIQDPFGSDPQSLSSAAPQMARELRALLAVAKAAERVNLRTRPGGPQMWALQAALARALARLRRASREGER